MVGHLPSGGLGYVECAVEVCADCGIEKIWCQV